MAFGGGIRVLWTLFLVRVEITELQDRPLCISYINKETTMAEREKNSNLIPEILSMVLGILVRFL